MEAGGGRLREDEGLWLREEDDEGWRLGFLSVKKRKGCFTFILIFSFCPFQKKISLHERVQRDVETALFVS